MFKFFREYNKAILVTGCIVLMIAFLLPQGAQMFAPSPETQVIGSVGGDEITWGDQQQAAAELQVLASFPILQNVGFTPQPDDALRWLLMVREAESMGLSASQMEARMVLESLGVDETQLAQLLRQTRTTREGVEQALRHWLMVQDYVQLFAGLVHQSSFSKLGNMAMAMQIQRQAMGGDISQYMMAQQQLNMLMAASSPSQRLSEPVVRHFVQGQQATVRGKAVLVSADRYLDQVPAPTDEQLQKLFNEHKDELPGTVTDANPYGFGYKSPDRVKLEWLTIPADAVRAAVQVDEADALAYYRQNQAEFTQTPPTPPPTPGATTPPPAPQPTVQPYTEVRGRIVERLRQQKADALAQQVIKAAQGVLLEDPAVRGLGNENGYRTVPGDGSFRPMSLEDAAARIQERFKVRPTVRGITDRWVNLSDLSSLDGLGEATLAARQDVSIEAYLRSAREMKPAPGNPLTPLRLQAGLPSEPLKSFMGDYYLLRITAAEPARAPEKLDEVRAQVVEDARKLAAYERLLADRERWVSRAKESGLEAVATEAGAAVLPIDPTSQATMMPGQEPTVPGIGPAEELLKRMFELGQTLSHNGAVAAAPAAERIGSAAVEPKLSLAVFQIDGFDPVTQSGFESARSDPMLGARINASMLRVDIGEESPLSLEAIQQRVGYKPANEG